VPADNAAPQSQNRQHSVFPPPLHWPSPTALMKEISCASVRCAWKATTMWKPPNSRPCSTQLSGQLLSPQNLSGDRDALLTEYMSRGFEQVTCRSDQQIEERNDPSKVDVAFHINEGQQIFVRNVLSPGSLHAARNRGQRAITHARRRPLNQTALLDTQRNLYELRALQ
jgi:hypothetical protein